LPGGEPELSETESCRNVLLRRGVPAEAIEIVGGVATSTFDEARLVRDYCRAHELKSILVVTTAFHTARSRWVFQEVLRETGIKIHLAAADHPFFTEANWYAKDEGLVLTSTSRSRPSTIASFILDASRKARFSRLARQGQGTLDDDGLTQGGRHDVERTPEGGKYMEGELVADRLEPMLLAEQRDAAAEYDPSGASRVTAWLSALAIAEMALPRRNEAS